MKKWLTKKRKMSIQEARHRYELAKEAMERARKRRAVEPFRALKADYQDAARDYLLLITSRGTER